MNAAFTSSAFEDAVSPQRLHRLLEQHYQGLDVHSRFPHIACRGTMKKVFEGTPESRLQERLHRAKELCHTYHLAALDQDHHIDKLDTAISELFRCSFPRYKPDFLTSYTSLTENRVVEQARNLLLRLPHIPLPFGVVEHSPALKHISEGYLLHPGDPREWCNIRAVSHIPTVVFLLALIISAAMLLHRDWQLEGIGALRELLNTFIELLEVCSTLSSTTASPTESEAWLVVSSILWSSWQRCTMLIRWFIFGLHIERGFTKSSDGFSFRRYIGGKHSSTPPHHDSLLSIQDAPQYMCRWALRRLQTDRSAICQDFRRLCALFDEAFAGRRPRCILRSQTRHLQCDGSSVEACQRFKGLVIADQSKHVEGGLSMCERLFWNELSYRSISGARAVVLNENQFVGQLQYCSASEMTLAISHVWSHGQGGRPETNGTGFNACLHRRYSRLAQTFGCNSYWMDTPCIPQDHHLRAEAIANINKVFTHSRVTLICDRDLMEIEVDEGPSKVKIYETIIAVLLVCDWNLRAWTFLESMRGRRRIHVLCKHEKIVSLKEVLEVVHKLGHIDIAVLAFTSEHLLPWRDLSHSSIPESDPDLSPLPVSEATSLLVNRHASRPGDDVVIWTLLVGKYPFSDPVDFWKEQWTYLREIPTGFLLSDIPRLSNIPGLRWAPSQPCLANSVQRFPSSESTSVSSQSASQQIFDGAHSRYGFIHYGGALEAVWFAYEFAITSRSRKVYCFDECDTATKIDIVVHDIATRFNLLSVRTCLLRPAAAYPVSENFSVLYQGKSGGPLVAVVSHHRKQAWKWEGLYEWPPEVELPVFHEQQFKIV